MKLRWSAAKSARLKRARGQSFEDVLGARFVAETKHPGRPHQLLMLFEIDEYIWAVPCVVGDGEVFLKTLYPSRKYTKLWKSGGLS